MRLLRLLISPSTASRRLISTHRLSQPSSLILPLAQDNNPNTTKSDTSNPHTTTNIKSHTSSTDSIDLHDDFVLLTDFYTVEDCRELLHAALWKLDRVDPVRKRHRRRTGQQGQQSQFEPLDHAQEDKGPSFGAGRDLFQGEYGFEEGHYDSVIRHYREMTMSTLPTPSTLYPNLTSLLNRAFTHLPSSPQITSSQNSPTPIESTSATPTILPPSTIIHLLHLAPQGQILAHVDNLDASGSTIMGISLGAERILRLEKKGKKGVGWDVLLPNGSVYIQKNKIRYEYEHSILPHGPDETWNGKELDAGHRISIMVRDAPPRPIGHLISRDV